MPERPDACSSARLAFADGLRGLAASWVLLFHLSTGHHVDALLAALPAGVDRAVFAWGHGGVAVFFVLSGCVLVLTADAALIVAACLAVAWAFWRAIERPSIRWSHRLSLPPLAPAAATPA